MDVKMGDYVPGSTVSTVCRCCLAEGCYKDISTEYFWMGKREVYSEMLSETLNLSIAFSKSGAPNSNSRLICEACISKLRDATDFKKQVQQCEKMFMQHLDPGSQVEIEVTPASSKDVKVECVKIENEVSDDDDVFEQGAPDAFDRPTLDDDDDYDDADDQPLTSLATAKATMKKERGDILDIMSNKQITVKRKIPETETRASKKTKKDITKPSASKQQTVKAKKSKGRKRKGMKTKSEVGCNDDNGDLLKEDQVQNMTDIGREKRKAFRNNIAIVAESCTAYPFRYTRGNYLCFFCKTTFIEPEKLRNHSLQHSEVNHKFVPAKYEPIKMDFAFAKCKLCNIEIADYEFLKIHLKVEHAKIINCTYGDTILPYNLNEKNCCQVCGKLFGTFLTLHNHMNDHFEHYICETCGKGFASAQSMQSHIRTHEKGSFPCRRCDKSFPSYASLSSHISKIHRANKRYKCPICEEKFVQYKHRVKHLNIIHGHKTPEFPCPFCPRIFDLSSIRTAHVRFRHLQEKNHVCEVCGMKFCTKYELQEHSVKHGGEKIFQCDICKKSYARMKTLKEHIRIHNNDRRFVCFVCAQSFVQKCSLKQHLRVHHPSNLKSGDN